MNKPISTLLQEIKVETGWSEPRIADELGTSQPTVNRILRGQKKCTSDTLRAIEALHKKTCVDSIAKVNGVARRRRTDKKSP